MNQRIRYIKDSSGHFMLGSKYYRDNKGNEYTIQFTKALDADVYLGTVSGTDISIEVRGTSPHKIKIALKAKLEELGCEFEKETRAKEE